MAKVLIYTSPTCAWCKKTKEFFKENKIKFKEINVASNKKAAKEMIKKSGQMGVPVIEIEYPDRKPEYVIGFNQPQLSYMLGI